MVHAGHAYVAHAFSGGFTVLDVRDPRAPRPVGFVPAPPGTWSVHLQAADDLLLVVNAKDLSADAAFQRESDYYGRSIGQPALQADRGYAAGLRVFDVSAPASPRRSRDGSGCRGCTRRAANARTGTPRAGATPCTTPSCTGTRPTRRGATAA